MSSIASDIHRQLEQDCMSTLIAVSNTTELEAFDAIYALPATPLQVRSWKHAQMFGPDPAWNIAVRFRLSGTLDRELLEQALQLLTTRHEALRTGLTEHADRLVQRILPRVVLPIEWCDLRGLTPGQQSAELLSLSLDHARHTFHLDAAPLMSTRLLRFSGTEHILLWNFHHSVCDGWSVGLLADDLMECYGELVAGRQPVALDLLDYGDYAAWLDAERDTPGYEEHRQYWRNQLQNSDAPALPVSWRRAETAASTPPEILSVVLPHELTAQITAVAQRQNATFFHVVLAGYAVLLRMQQMNDTVVVGTPLSGRDQSELEKTVGTFVNYLPLRFEISPEQRFSAVLDRVRDVITDGIEHVAYRYEDMLQDVRSRAGDIAKEAELFSSVFICQKDFVRPVTAAGLSLTPLPSLSPGALHPFTMFMVERVDGWRLSCEVDNESISAAMGTKLLEQYRGLLAHIVAAPAYPVSNLAALAGIEVPKHNEIIEEMSGPASADAVDEEVPALKLTICEVLSIPATESQLRFSMLNRLNEGDTSFNLRIRLELKGKLDVTALKDSWLAMIDRHEILRTTFEERDGRLWQNIHPQGALDFRAIEIAESFVGSIESAAQKFFAQEDLACFSLTDGPLFRVRLVQLEPDCHWLAITLSHAIADGWSSGLLLQQLQQLYGERVNGIVASRKLPQPQFSAYATAEHSLLDGPEKDSRLAWWAEQLKGTWRPLELPRDRDSACEDPWEARAGFSSQQLSASTVIAARRFARECNATLFAVFGAAFQALLAKYSGRSEILFLTPLANRDSQTEQVIGPLASPICLAAHVEPNATFRQLVMQLSNQSMEAFDKVLPFGNLASALDVRLVEGRNPLTQIMYFYQRAFVHDMEWAGIRVKALPDAPAGVAHEWRLGVVERAEGIFNELLYDATSYSSQTIHLVLQHLGRLLSQAVLRPDIELTQLQILTPEEISLQASGKPVLPVTESLLLRRVPEKARIDTVFSISQRPANTPTEQRMLLVWRELFDRRKFGVEANFFELGGHSLLLARLQAAVEREWGIRLTAADVFRNPEMIELCGRIDREKAGNVQPHDSRIVPIQPFGEQRPLLIISQSMIFRTLAQELGTDQPTFALQMLDEDVTPELLNGTFEQIAAFYVGLIRRTQPAGPYRVAGWCVGGWIAYEVSRQLEAAGEKVELLLMLDAWAPAYWRKQSALRQLAMRCVYRGQRFRWILRRLRKATSAQRSAYVRRSLHGTAAALAQNATAILRGLHLPVRVKLTEEMRRSEQLEYTASRFYNSGPVDANLLLFRSEEQPAGPLLATDMGWARLLKRPVEVEVLPGDHQEIFDRPGSRIMATRVREILGLAPIVRNDCEELDQRNTKSAVQPVEVLCARWN